MTPFAPELQARVAAMVGYAIGGGDTVGTVALTREGMNELHFPIPAIHQRLRLHDSRVAGGVVLVPAGFDYAPHSLQ